MPAHHVVDDKIGDHGFFFEQLEYLPAEGVLQVVRQRRGASDEHVVSIKTAVCGNNMQMGIKILEIAEGLDRDDAAWGRIIIRHHGLEVFGEHVPGPAGNVKFLEWFFLKVT